MVTVISRLLKLTKPHVHMKNHARLKSTIRKIEKLLIANRGEIACRIMRTANKLGIRTVAVYSDADENALHVAMADEAYNIGPPPASESYLRADKILEIAVLSKCQAIHPGYGFLSENLEFAGSCQKENVIFIGPPASAIRDMGIKSTSKAIMSEAGVPVVRGYHDKDQSIERLKKEALHIGYPVMIKAVRGGGGKGMRIAYTEKDFEESLQSAMTEAQKAFGDDVVLLEKFVSEPRHVEVQVFADTHGNVVYLYERDCSVQRRHQKIIEEAPAPGLSDDLRSKLGSAAVSAAKAVGYIGAGTVEFILDKNTHDFYFMEMNTRLQVEHPITEMITGTDLVEWQIKVASGEELPLKQNQISIKGHAFEGRIYAENPRGGFLPGAGPLLYLSTPEPSEDTRIETGVREGDEVSVHYDPMIAKLVVWGKDRSAALSILRTKLLQYNIAGLETNVNFLLDLTRHKEFVIGNVHTNFIRDHYDTLFKDQLPNDIQLTQAALAMVLKDGIEALDAAASRNDQYNPFIVESGFRLNYDYIRELTLRFNNTDMNVAIKYVNNNEYQISCDGELSWKTVKGALNKINNKLVLQSSIDGVKLKCNIYSNCDSLVIFDRYGKVQFSLTQHNFETEDEESTAIQDKAVAPMHGILDKLLVKPGDEVKRGDSLFVLIAMKMEHVVKATRDAKIAKIFFKAGENVAKDAIIVQFVVNE